MTTMRWVGFVVVIAIFLGSGATLFQVVGEARSEVVSAVQTPIHGSRLRSAGRVRPDPGLEQVSVTDSRPDLVEVLDDGVSRIDLRVLAFAEYDPPELRGENATALSIDDFPETVRGLDGKTVEAQGYVITLDFDFGKVRRFLLTRFPPGCCFGATPVLDEWIEVTLAEGLEARFSPYAVVRVRGTLSVGESLDEAGFAESLYRMVGDEVSEAR